MVLAKGATVDAEVGKMDSGVPSPRAHELASITNSMNRFGRDVMARAGESERRANSLEEECTKIRVALSEAREQLRLKEDVEAQLEELRPEHTRLLGENIEKSLEILTLRANVALARSELNHLQRTLALVEEHHARERKLYERALARERESAERTQECSAKKEEELLGQLRVMEASRRRSAPSPADAPRSPTNDADVPEGPVHDETSARSAGEPWWQRATSPATAKGVARFVASAARVASVTVPPDLRCEVDEVAAAAARVIDEPDDTVWLRWAEELGALARTWTNEGDSMGSRNPGRGPSRENSAPHMDSVRIDSSFDKHVHDRGQRLTSRPPTRSAAPATTTRTDEPQAESDPRPRRRRRLENRRLESRPPVCSPSTSEHRVVENPSPRRSSATDDRQRGKVRRRGVLVLARPGLLRVRVTGDEARGEPSRNEAIVKDDQLVCCRLDLRWMAQLLKRTGIGSRTARDILLPCLYNYSGGMLSGDVQHIAQHLGLNCGVESLAGALELVASCSRGVTR
ncbi:MAG: hypothetical protein KC468_36590, partial [Myxococcales bacterium]|nr:hypothetical protein [Myxococcales bacterium]